MKNKSLHVSVVVSMYLAHRLRVISGSHWVISPIELAWLVLSVTQSITCRYKLFVLFTEFLSLSVSSVLIPVILTGFFRFERHQLIYYSLSEVIGKQD